MCCLGSAVSEEVSELVWIQKTPRSRATSWTANAPDEASASMRSSQPSVLTSSRATRAASCGCPLESRITISICRPASPPAALIFSTSIVTALRDEVPSCATRPERIVGMPTLIVLACARDPRGCECHRAGAHQRQRRPPAHTRLAFLGHADSLDVRASLNPCRRSDVSMPREFQRKQDDVKPIMNYESEFILRHAEAISPF